MPARKKYVHNKICIDKLNSMASAIILIVLMRTEERTSARTVQTANGDYYACLCAGEMSVRGQDFGKGIEKMCHGSKDIFIITNYENSGKYLYSL